MRKKLTRLACAGEDLMRPPCLGTSTTWLKENDVPLEIEEKEQESAPPRKVGLKRAVRESVLSWCRSSALESLIQRKAHRNHQKSDWR